MKCPLWYFFAMLALTLAVTGPINMVKASRHCPYRLRQLSYQPPPRATIIARIHEQLEAEKATEERQLAQAMVNVLIRDH